MAPQWRPRSFVFPPCTAMMWCITADTIQPLMYGVTCAHLEHATGRSSSVGFLSTT